MHILVKTCMILSLLVASVRSMFSGRNCKAFGPEEELGVAMVHAPVKVTMTPGLLLTEVGLK